MRECGLRHPFATHAPVQPDCPPWCRAAAPLAHPRGGQCRHGPRGCRRLLVRRARRGHARLHPPGGHRFFAGRRNLLQPEPRPSRAARGHCRVRHCAAPAHAGGSHCRNQLRTVRADDRHPGGGRPGRSRRGSHTVVAQPRGDPQNPGRRRDHGGAAFLAPGMDAGSRRAARGAQPRHRSAVHQLTQQPHGLDHRTRGPARDPRALPPATVSGSSPTMPTSACTTEAAHPMPRRSRPPSSTSATRRTASSAPTPSRSRG